MDKLEQEEMAATVFSYLIRGLSSGQRGAMKSELMKKLEPIRELYGLSDEVYPLYIDQCIAHKKFLKVQDAIEAFGNAIARGEVSPRDERIMMQWVLNVQNQVRTYGNIKTKRRRA
ncbi:hypothetical protein Mtc_0640 [Methanocella conradii HZ254]|uniref:Uncharacterized protein n=1 Tax=Methanocella conradii (strain DSM 24694 / JCM 17849 / CGMCC 1.5162 / HZ254) TaxID=1041930 RepID=H8I6T3_METCZ|nr:hypothetical protein [Methanocella conradii]AFC99403.1 hypothetical protein Mtc_0640 [Methanocella conradii HZ254]